MERKKHIIMVMLFLFYGGISSSASLKKEIYEAYVYDNMEHWRNIIDKMEQEKRKETDYLLQLINFQYGYIGWCLGNDRNNQAKNYLEKAEKNLELYSQLNGNVSIVYSYQSAFYGFRIGLSRIKAPVYGPRSVKHAELSIELDEKNPMGYIQYGNSQYYMPAVFGGSKELAIEYFQKAQELMEQNPEQIKEDWNYLSLLTTIAQSFEDLEQYPRAQAYYHKILQLEPDFKWVKNELYPAFLKKHKK